MKRLFLLALLMAVTLSACSQNPNVHKDSETQPQIGADQLRKDIGEMLLVGFRGTTITEQDPIVRDITKYHVGSVILFEYDAPSGTRHRNISSPQQIKNLCADLQKYSSEPLLIGIDQEGGNVTRLRSRDGFPPTLTAEASARGGDDSVSRNARTIAVPSSANWAAVSPPTPTK